MSLEARKRELEEALEEGRVIAKRTDLTQEERQDLFARVERIESLKAEVSKELRMKAALSDKLGVSSDEELMHRLSTKSLGEAFVESDEFLTAKAANWLGNSAAFSFKAEPAEISTRNGSGSVLTGLVVPERLPGIWPMASYPTRLADLIPKMNTNSNAVTFYEETSETDTIGPQATEGSEKGNFTLDGAERTETLEVVGGMAAVTRQTLADAPFMAGFVNTRMTMRLDKVEEDLILNGDGTNGELNGFYNRTLSTQAQGADTLIDAIFKAADKCLVDGGFFGEAVVINPTDWQPIVLSKDGNDRYYGTGPFAQAIGDTIWGMQVVRSNFTAVDTILVGAFKAASFLVGDGGVEVRTSDSHSDYFKKNKVAVLIEKREALGVYAPLAFCELTSTDS